MLAFFRRYLQSCIREDLALPYFCMLFQNKIRESGEATSTITENIPKALDFFKYSNASLCKRKISNGHDPMARKRPRIEELKKDNERRAEYSSDSGSDSGSGSGDGEEEQISQRSQKQRVKVRGQAVPAPVNTFEELNKRYKVSSNLITNLKRSGFEYPTGIQSYGCPVLLEVC
jgi:ATP-dependent RNA helicase DDX52/ROK1